MNELFHKQGTLTAIVFIILGIVLLARPTATLIVVCRFIGFAVLISGIGMLITAIADHSRSSANLAAAVVMICVGLLIAANPAVLASFLPIVIGILIIAGSVATIMQATHGFGSGREVRIAMSVISLILGIMIVAAPFTAAAFVVRIIGIALIYTGIMNMVNFKYMSM